MIPYTFLFDAFIAFAAISLAFGYLRVYWSYIISGELVANLGLSMIFHYFYITGDSITGSNWHYLYAAGQSIVLLALIFSLTKRRFIGLYALSAIVALVTGLLIDNEFNTSLAYYPLVVGAIDICKVGFMASYWNSTVRGGVCGSFKRLSVWQI